MPDPQASTRVDVKVQGCDALPWADAGGVYFSYACVCGSPLCGFALHISTCYELCACPVRCCVHTALVVPSGAEIM